MNSFIKTIKKHPKTIATITIISLLVYLMMLLGLDVRAIAIITIVVGYITNVFAGLITVTASIPIIGPIVVKLFTIPFFWLLNFTGYLTSFVAIKKGYGKTLLTHKIITLVLIIGIIIGYILGHLIPIH